jgi:hypothetical protein
MIYQGVEYSYWRHDDFLSGASWSPMKGVVFFSVSLAPFYE